MITNFRHHHAALVLLMALAPVAHGQTSPAKKELVQKVIQLQQGSIDGLARNLAEQPVAAMLQQAAQIVQQRVPADKRDALAKDLQADARKYVDEATPLIRERAQKLAPSVLGPALEEKFSEDELKQVIAALEMMQNPAVRKFQQTGGELERSMVEKVIGETRTTIEPKLNALRQTMEKRMEAAGARPSAGAASGAAPKAPAKK